MEIKENDRIDYSEHKIHEPLHLTDPAISWSLDDGVINAVITAAVWSEERRPGIWQRMIRALSSGAEKTRRVQSTPFCSEPWRTGSWKNFIIWRQTKTAPGDRTVFYIILSSF